MADSTGRYTSIHDMAGQITGVMAPNNQRMTYSYDAVGLRKSMDVAGLGRTTFMSNATGQSTSIQNANGNRTTFTYDDESRPDCN